MKRFLFILFFFGFSLCATAQQAHRALYLTVAKHDSDRFKAAHSYDLIMDENRAREMFTRFLEREHRLYKVRYRAVYLLIDEQRLLNQPEYAEKLPGAIRFLRENGINRIEAFSGLKSDLTTGKQRPVEFARLIKKYNEQVEEISERFDAIHLDIEPNFHPDFEGFRVVSSDVNQEIYESMLTIFRKVKEEAGDLPIVADVASPWFFEIPGTRVASTGNSLGLSLLKIVDEINLMNYRDWALGFKRLGNEPIPGMLESMRPILKHVVRLNKKMHISVETDSVRDEEIGGRLTFSVAPHIRQGNAGARAMNKELELLYRNIPRRYRRYIPYFGIHFYGSYLHILEN